MNIMVIIWAALVVLFLIVEATTVQLVSIWCAAGALVSLVAAFLHAKLWLQLVLFFAVSGLMILLLYPLVKKKMVPKPTATNADRVIGQLAVVTETVDNLNATGAVKVGGVEWTARSRDGRVIPEGETATVVKIDGVKLVVK